ncbi:hypothetical protein [Thomasclavelia cocleata]|uniref:hypothetical protein n=1 Tax=Thomasclavelia cocleata TaxID=69824 RepID=UPI00255AB09C|nr:hypothetical protein [Thomasclavelia cocleata]
MSLIIKKIIYKNFVIECNDKIDTSVAGVYEISYKTNSVNEQLIKKKVYIKDISKPVVKLLVKKIERYIDEIDNINWLEYFEVSDNSGTADLDYYIDTRDIKQIPGIYTVKFTVEDSSGNNTTKKIKIILIDRPVENNQEFIQDEIQEKSNKKNEIRSDIKKDSNELNEINGKKQDVSIYNKFFSGNSIEAYNQAITYAESIFNNGKANGYSVNPTGEGFQVDFR